MGGASKIMKRKAQWISRPYLFIPRKGQITISFLLIFVILFSVFALGLVAEREMWASAKFRGAVDAAALSAGADMAKAADLIITVTSIRLLLFVISRVLYILSIPLPLLYAAASTFNSIAKSISIVLGNFSKFIPLIYLVKAEIDAYGVFKSNFNLKDQGESKWSIDDYGIIVIPNYTLENLGDLNIFPNLNDMNEVSDFLREGVSVFGYRKLSFLEQAKLKFNITNNSSGNNILSSVTPQEVKEWINGHDFIVSSSYISKTKDNGIDLSDAVKISDFLSTFWENNPNEALPKNEDTGTEKSLEDILKKAGLIPTTVDEKTKLIKYEDGGNLPYYNNRAVYAANDILKDVDKYSEIDGIDQDCLDDLNKLIHRWINFCRAYSGNENGEWNYYGREFINKVKSLKDESTKLKNLVDKYSEAMEKLNSINNSENPQIDPNQVNEIKDSLNNLSGQISVVKDKSDEALNFLSTYLNQVPSSWRCTIYQTCYDKEGKPYSCNSSKTIDLSSMRNPMSDALKNLEDISTKCSSTLNDIKGIVSNLDNKIGEGVNDGEKSVEDSLKNNLFEKIGGLLSSFKGMPGGNTIALLMGSYDCKQDGCGPGEFVFTDKFKISLPNGGNYCGIPIVGNMLCAFTKDIGLGLTVFNGEKFQFISYYSARLEKPPFIADEVIEIKEENTDLNTLINNLTGQISDSLVLKENPKDVAMDAAVSISGAILSGIFSGGTTVIIGGVLTALSQTVLIPYVKDFIGEKVIPFLRDQAIGWIDEFKNSEQGSSIISGVETALKKFVNTFNYIQDFRIKLIGYNNVVYKNNSMFLVYIGDLNIKVAPNKSLDIEDKYEESYSFEPS